MKKICKPSCPIPQFLTAGEDYQTETETDPLYNPAPPNGEEKVTGSIYYGDNHKTLSFNRETIVHIAAALEFAQRNAGIEGFDFEDEPMFGSEGTEPLDEEAVEKLVGQLSDIAEFYRWHRIMDRKRAKLNK